MKLYTTARELLDYSLWGEYCNEIGCNPYAVNEGLLDENRDL